MRHRTEASLSGEILLICHITRPKAASRVYKRISGSRSSTVVFPEWNVRPEFASFVFLQFGGKLKFKRSPSNATLVKFNHQIGAAANISANFSFSLASLMMMGYNFLQSSSYLESL